MAPIEIRPATESDLDTLIAFNAALAKETEGKALCEATLRQGILAVLRTPELGSYIVAEVMNSGARRIVGQLMVTFEWSDWRNGMIWWLQSIFVDPAWRRQGVYGAMHRHIAEQAQGRPNICGVRLYVERNNQTAQSVYQNLGFSPAGYIVYERLFSQIVNPQHGTIED